MATKADFTEDEWKTMQRGVSGAGALTAMADPDFTDSFGEASALAKYLAERHQSSDSVFIRDLAGVRGTGFGMTASRDEVEQGTLEALRSAVATLEQKAPDELPAYRELVTGLAQHVAEAKTGVKQSETDAIAKINEALGVAAS